MKDIVILGGPNGAGKTTAASILLPTMLGIREFQMITRVAQFSNFSESAERD